MDPVDDGVDDPDRIMRHIRDLITRLRETTSDAMTRMEMEMHHHRVDVAVDLAKNPAPYSSPPSADHSLQDEFSAVRVDVDEMLVLMNRKPGETLH